MCIKLYVLTLSMTSAFAVTGTLPIPLLASLLGLVALGVGSIFRQTLRVPRPTMDDLLILLMLMFMGVSALVNIGRIEMRWSHALAFLAVVILYFYSPLLMLWTNSRHRKNVDLFFVYGVFIAATFALLEFTLKNIVGFPIDLYILRPLAQIADPTFMGMWIRARSFVEEPGHFALYLNIMAPLAILRARQFFGQHLALFLSGLVLLAFVTTFSSAGVVAMTVGASLAALFDRQLRRAAIWGVFVLAGILAGWSLLGGSPAAVLIELFVGKPSPGNESLLARMAVWAEVLELWQSYPILGAGPGSAQGAINWYLEVAAQTGSIGLVLLFAFFVLQVRRAVKLEMPLRGVMLFSLFASFVHFALVSNYWYPWLWFIFVYMRVARLEHGVVKRVNIG